MKLSIIIPSYNEKTNLFELIHAIKEAYAGDKEIILVDDGSNDGSVEYINREIRPLIDKTIFHSRNLGKGAAIRTAIPHVTGDIIIIQDADLEYDPMDYSKILAPLQSGKADVVYGSRFLNGSAHACTNRSFYWGNRFLTWFTNLVTGLKLTDMETCYKAFRAEITKNLELHQKRFGFEPEITVKLAKGGYRIEEVPISYKGRSQNEGKKIGWIDGLVAIWCILRYRFF